MILSRSWLLLTLPVAVVAIALLSWTVLRLVRTVRKSVVASVPVREQQQVTFDKSGDFALSLEADIGSRLGGLQFSLLSGGGATVPLHRILVRTKVSSFSRARVELYSFTLSSPGTFTLRVEGLEPADSNGSDAIVFTRRFQGTLVTHILALIVLGAAFIGSIVVSGFALSGTSLSPASPQTSSDASPTLESALQRSAAVVRARTVVQGGPPRYEVLETLAGAIPSEIAGANQPGGLLLDMRAPTAAGYEPVDGQEIVVLLGRPNVVPSAGVVLGEPIVLLPIVDGRVVYAPRGQAKLELTLDEVRRLAAK
jgi:hypothetical protein